MNGGLFEALEFQPGILRALLAVIGFKGVSVGAGETGFDRIAAIR